jgi:hypothetical protein
MLDQIMKKWKGLSDHLFDYISSISPLVNVDVIVVDSFDKFILT